MRHQGAAVWSTLPEVGGASHPCSWSRAQSILSWSTLWCHVWSKWPPYFGVAPSYNWWYHGVISLHDMISECEDWTSDTVSFFLDRLHFLSVILCYFFLAQTFSQSCLCRLWVVFKWIWYTTLCFLEVSICPWGVSASFWGPGGVSWWSQPCDRGTLCSIPPTDHWHMG